MTIVSHPDSLWSLLPTDQIQVVGQAPTVDPNRNRIRIYLWRLCLLQNMLQITIESMLWRKEEISSFQSSDISQSRQSEWWSIDVRSNTRSSCSNEPLDTDLFHYLDHFEVILDNTTHIGDLGNLRYADAEFRWVNIRVTGCAMWINHPAETSFLTCRETHHQNCRFRCWHLKQTRAGQLYSDALT